MGDRVETAVSNVIPFPARPREPGDVELVHGMAPSRSLVDTLLAEAGIPLRDATSGMALELGYQAWTFEAGYGRDASALHLRRSVDALTAHAAKLCRDYHASADSLVRLEMRDATGDFAREPVWQVLQDARAELRGRAIAARVAADAAIGAAAALSSYIGDGSGALSMSAAEPRQLALFATGA